MPLTTLRPLVSERFREINELLTAVGELESINPLDPDPENVRALRGLLYVHLYAAFEYAMDQAFIRLAQHLSGMAVARKHLRPPLLSVALDAEFDALGDLKNPQKKFRKRIEAMERGRDGEPAAIVDTVLSKTMQSASCSTIEMAFEVYGIQDPYLCDPSTRGYIDDVVGQRHAVAHGRESPVTVGSTRVADLRIRYDALYRQAMYVIETLSTFCTSRAFILPRYRRMYEVKPPL